MSFKLHVERRSVGTGDSDSSDHARMAEVDILRTHDGVLPRDGLPRAGGVGPTRGLATNATRTLSQSRLRPATAGRSLIMRFGRR